MRRSVLERRAFEFRAVDDGAELPVLEGVAVPYGQRAKIGQFTEEFRAGGMTQVEVIANLLHDHKQILAVSGRGLTLTDGPEAMRARLELPDTTSGRDAAVLVRSGVLRGFSVEFRATKETWNGTHRTVEEAMMYGLGLVARPAYQGAVVVEGRDMDTSVWFAREGARFRKGRVRWRSL